MEIKKNKELYDAPSTLVFEVKTEGIICVSGTPTLQEYNVQDYFEE